MTDADLRRAMALLRLSPQDVLALRQGSAKQRQAALETLKEKARKRFKQAARVLHPDRSGGDAAKAEDFKLLGLFIEQLDRMVPPSPAKSKKGTLRIHISVRVPNTR